MGRGCVLASILLLSLRSAVPVAAQASPQTPSPCAPPALQGLVAEPNIFTEEQEEWLGDILNENLAVDYNFIQDPENNYLQGLGERLLKQLPPTRTNFRFIIMDFPEADSFGVGGGRIYISRKLIAMARSEDELAGVLGHEIGHVITHQSGIDTTRFFREVLGVSEVTDRNDIFNKWNRLLDTGAKKRVSFGSKREEEEQLIADRIALYAMIRAGYRSSAYTDFFDRIAETKGHTGNFWSDMFGVTSADSRRLRALIKDPMNLPETCIAALPSGSAPAFAKWQQEVIEASLGVAHEQLPGLLRKVTLKPMLRDDLKGIIFSPDGKYLLAQDGTSIFVLTREPFASLFRVEASDASVAQFTPDSSAIAFFDKELRVQKWDLKSQKRISVRELSTPCANASLSPTGDILACLKSNLDLLLIDVQSGQVLATKHKLYQLRIRVFGVDPVALAVGLANLHFSPDGRYFMGGFDTGIFGFDTVSKTEIKLPPRVREIAQEHFNFIGPDEVIGMGGPRLDLAMRVRFSTGQVLDQFYLASPGDLSPTGSPGFVLVWPSSAARTAVIDLNKGRIVFMYKLAGVALFGDSLVTEHFDGQITLQRWSDKQVLASLPLPGSPLEESRTAAFSTDGNWLALSSYTRGGLWKLETGERAVYTRDFHGAWFDQEDLIAKFAKSDEDPDRIVRLNTVTLKATSLRDLTAAPAFPGSTPGVCSDAAAGQHGDLLIRVAREDTTKLFGSHIVKICDLRTGAQLWEHKVEREVPKFFYDSAAQALTFVVGDFDNIKEAARADSRLQQRLNAIEGRKGKQDSYLIQVFQARTGNPLGSILVDTGNLSFIVTRAFATADFVLVSDNNNRTLVYSMKSGDQIGKTFGHVVAVSSNGDRVLVENSKGDAQLYETSTMRSLHHFVFPAWITYSSFLPDGKTLMVLSSDQLVYRLDTSASAPAVTGNQAGSAK